MPYDVNAPMIPDELMHGVFEIGYSPTLGCFTGECLCDWQTSRCRTVEEVGREFDEHFSKSEKP